MLYYLEDLDLYETDIIRTKLEAIWVDVELHSQRISLSMMYRSPKDQNFFNTLSDEIEKLWAQKKNILIMGDLNADILRRYSENEDDEKVAGKKLLHVIDRFAFKNVIKHPTGVTATTKTLLDVTIISDTSMLVKAGVFDTRIADNRLNCTVLKLSRNRIPPRTREVINCKKCKEANFTEKLKFVPWHTCNIFYDIDDNYWMMEKLYKDVSTEFLPKRKVKMRSKSLPWMNGDIRKLMNKRYKLLKQAQKTQDPEDFEKYKALRSQVNIALRKAESKYWKDLLKSKDKGSRDFWKIVKKMTGKERQDKRMGPLRDSDNNLVLDDSKKAETLNNFFSTIGEKLASNFETYTHDNSPSDILAMNKGEIIDNVTISEGKFEEKFKKLNIRKSQGADEITAREMKIVGDEVSYGFASITRSGILKVNIQGNGKLVKLRPYLRKGKRTCATITGP